jgi:hypothetical protein
MPDAPEDFAISAEGIVALGVPIGSRNYILDKTTELLSQMHPPKDALTLLTPRTALLLLLKCFNPRPGFLMRTAADYTLLRPAAAAFDTAITDCILSILTLPPSEKLKSQIFFPRRLGGLGFMRHDGIASEKSQLISRLSFQNFLATTYPIDFQYTQQHLLPYWNPIRLGDSEDLTDHTGITPDIIASMTHISARSTLSTGTKAAQKVQADLFRTSLSVSPSTRQQAAFFLSSSASTTAFISSTTGLSSTNYFRNDDFICAVRAILGHGPTNSPSDVPRLCTCNKIIHFKNEPLHAILCPSHAGSWTLRHNDIRDLLCKLLRKAHPDCPLQLEALVGKTNPDQHGAVREVFSDITLAMGTETLLIDVAVVSPGGSVYLQYPTLSSINQDGASKHKEQSKRSHYGRIAAPHTPAPNSVIPFVLESSGRLGPTALGFLFRILPTQTFLRTSFLNDVALICQRYNGRILRISRDRERRHLINGALAPIHG